MWSLPARARVARGTSETRRAHVRALCLRRSAPALSTTQSHSDETGSDSDWGPWRGLLRSQSVADAPVGTGPLSRLVLSTRRTGAVAHHQARRFTDLTEPLPDQPGDWIE